MVSTDRPGHAPTPRQRLSRDERHRQLVAVAWRLIREEGTDALSLGRLAERAGVTKPVVYDHFGTRGGLLAALYGEFDARQTRLLDAALAAAQPSLEAVAGVVASSYIGCVLTQGREVSGIVAALAGSPELEAVKRGYEAAFLEKCRAVLSPFADGGEITAARLRAMLGAAEALSGAAATGELALAEAEAELRDTIAAMVVRSRAVPSRAQLGRR